MKELQRIRRRKSRLSKPYHVMNDSAMVPDWGFTKQLHALDPELDVVWNWGKDKWEIWRFPRDGREPFHMITVQTKNKTYRELGADILLKLQEGDPHRYTLKELINYFEEMDRQAERRRAAELRDKIRTLAKETNRYARGILTVQVPRVYEEIAVPINSRPSIPIIEMDSRARVRRTIEAT